ncbi:MAG: hypothetical protein ABI601_15675 [bacterium]
MLRRRQFRFLASLLALLAVSVEPAAKLAHGLAHAHELADRLELEHGRRDQGILTRERRTSAQSNLRLHEAVAARATLEAVDHDALHLASTASMLLTVPLAILPARSHALVQRLALVGQPVGPRELARPPSYRTPPRQSRAPPLG